MLNDAQAVLAKITVATQQMAEKTGRRTGNPARPQVTPIQVDDEVLDAAATPQVAQTPRVAYPDTPGQSTAGCPTPVGTPRVREPSEVETPRAKWQRMEQGEGTAPSCP